MLEKKVENTVEGLVRIDDIPGDYYLYNKEQNAMLGRKKQNRFNHRAKWSITPNRNKKICKSNKRYVKSKHC